MFKSCNNLIVAAFLIHTKQIGFVLLYPFMNRTNDLLNIRQQVITDISKTSFDLESFQNITLRPILKFQNTLIVQLIDYELVKLKVLSHLIKDLDFIKNHIHKNLVLKQQLIGLTIGLFTSSEMEYYLKNQSNLNKRINQLIIERFCSNLSKNTSL